MEVSVARSSSQLNLRKVEFFSKNLNSTKIRSLKISPSRGVYVSQSHHRLQWPSRSSSALFSLRASANTEIQDDSVPSKAPKCTRAKANDAVKLFVGLPLDTVSITNKINNARAIEAGLKALKLLGIEGVELPIWWGVAEKEAMGKYDWSSYLSVVEMVEKLGLKLHFSLCFHASKESKIPLPQWVSRVGESDPSIFFTDRSGHPYKDCLSLAADDVPIFDGKTPLQVYGGFFDSFKSSFSPFFGSTITGVSVGLGPDGELRYPSHRDSPKRRAHIGAGEFQCYDKNMLEKLKSHAEAHGNALWGLGGPHDAPSYDGPPFAGGFFAENGGSWDSPYGDFFLSWYSDQLTLHGDKVLSLASSAFKDVEITLSGRIPLIHSLYKSRSHPAELTVGIYNTEKRDGYEAIAEVFSRNSCKVIIPGMDMSDSDQPGESRSSLQLLTEQITSCFRNRGIEVSGQNSSSSEGFEQMRKYLSGKDKAVDVFFYQRMGAYFFSPEHFPSFTQFVRSLDQLPIQSSDDLPVEDYDGVDSPSGSNLRMQTA